MDDAGGGVAVREGVAACFEVGREGGADGVGVSTTVAREEGVFSTRVGNGGAGLVVSARISAAISAADW